ncbi:glycosyltransferase [Propionicimonas sp.]|uniref:glycosyltransferase n=1 Tax=Propionicimonas sp. TaxID=1955623 RepID=UPI0039E2693D
MTRTMLVASAGGHLDELMIHVDRLGIDTDDAVWVTSPTPQTESLLRDQNVVWIPRVGSGEAFKAIRALPKAIQIQRQVKPDLVVTTGALFAAPHILAATLARCETWFIDSATRVAGPSSTGKFAQRFTRAKLYTQNAGWDDAWTLVPSVFDAFEAYPRPGGAPAPLNRVTVSLGSELWPFPRAIERVISLLPEAAITWQVGTTSFSRDGQPLRQWLPAEELRAAISASDLVVMHAGVGSVLVALDEGKVPVILPRRQHHKEMVDDHQTEIAAVLADRGLAITVDPDELTAEHLSRAAGLAARRRPEFRA